VAQIEPSFKEMVKTIALDCIEDASNSGDIYFSLSTFSLFPLMCKALLSLPFFTAFRTMNWLPNDETADENEKKFEEASVCFSRLSSENYNFKRKLASTRRKLRFISAKHTIEMALFKHKHLILEHKVALVALNLKRLTSGLATKN